MPSAQAIRDRACALAAEVEARGVRGHCLTMWQLRALWRIGVPVMPPLYASFKHQALTIGVLSGVVFGALTRCGMLGDSDAPTPGWGSVLMAGVFYALWYGVVFTALSRWWMRKFRARHGIPAEFWAGAASAA